MRKLVFGSLFMFMTLHNLLREKASAINSGDEKER